MYQYQPPKYRPSRSLGRVVKQENQTDLQITRDKFRDAFVDMLKNMITDKEPKMENYFYAKELFEKISEKNSGIIQYFYNYIHRMSSLVTISTENFGLIMDFFLGYLYEKQEGIDEFWYMVKGELGKAFESDGCINLSEASTRLDFYHRIEPIIKGDIKGKKFTEEEIREKCEMFDKINLGYGNPENTIEYPKGKGFYKCIHRGFYWYHISRVLYSINEKKTEIIFFRPAIFEPIEEGIPPTEKKSKDTNNAKPPQITTQNTATKITGKPTELSISNNTENDDGWRYVAPHSSATLGGTKPKMPSVKSEEKTVAAADIKRQSQELTARQEDIIVINPEEEKAEEEKIAKEQKAKEKKAEEEKIARRQKEEQEMLDKKLKERKEKEEKILEEQREKERKEQEEKDARKLLQEARKGLKAARQGLKEDLQAQSVQPEPKIESKEDKEKEQESEQTQFAQQQPKVENEKEEQTQSVQPEPKIEGKEDKEKEQESEQTQFAQQQPKVENEKEGNPTFFENLILQVRNSGISETEKAYLEGFISNLYAVDRLIDLIADKGVDSWYRSNLVEVNYIFGCNPEQFEKRFAAAIIENPDQIPKTHQKIDRIKNLLKSNIEKLAEKGIEKIEGKKGYRVTDKDLLDGWVMKNDEDKKAGIHNGIKHHEREIYKELRFGVRVN
ncbi:MAG: hypothetical protein FWD01_00695, partial [Defluviitaleaceae bacterium]|nr:hypothetical protein [Defluviitaleaceae bacterium]